MAPHSLAQVSEWLRSSLVPNLQIQCADWVQCDSLILPEQYDAPSSIAVGLLALKGLDLQMGNIPYQELEMLLYITNPEKLTVEWVEHTHTSYYPFPARDNTDSHRASFKPCLASLCIGRCTTTDLETFLRIVQYALPNLEWSSIQKLHLPYLDSVPSVMNFWGLSPKELSFSIDRGTMLQFSGSGGSPVLPHIQQIEYLGIVIHENIREQALVESAIMQIIIQFASSMSIFCIEYAYSVDTTTPQPLYWENRVGLAYIVERLLSFAQSPVQQLHIITYNDQNDTGRKESVAANGIGWTHEGKLFIPLRNKELSLVPYNLNGFDDCVMIYQCETNPEKTLFLWVNNHQLDGLNTINNWHTWIHSYSDSFCTSHCTIDTATNGTPPTPEHNQHTIDEVSNSDHSDEADDNNGYDRADNNDDENGDDNNTDPDIDDGDDGDDINLSDGDRADINDNTEDNANCEHSQVVDLPENENDIEKEIWEGP